MIEPTDDMARAYLEANKLYWYEVDNGPKRAGVWRNGTPHEATMAGLGAALALLPADAAAAALTDLLGVMTEIVGAVPDVSALGVDLDRIRVVMVKATAALAQQPADKAPDLRGLLARCADRLEVFDTHAQSLAAEARAAIAKLSA